MKKLKLAFSMLLLLSLNSYGLVEFESGGLVRAADFNANFSELENKISDGESSDLFVNAQVNSVAMKVSSTALGYYSVISPTGINLLVNVEGYPLGTFLYYENNDCTGQGYFSLEGLTSLEDVNHVYSNPKIDHSISFSYDGNKVYYSSHSELVKLHYRSRQYSNTECSAVSGSAVTFPALENDPSVTGFSAFPLLISGIGSELKISKEVGISNGQQSGSYDVLANGTKIGSVSYLPSSSSTSINSVSLDEYPGKSVTINKDGTFYGLFNTAALYFLGNSCAGNAYVRVLTDYDKKWWFGSAANTGPVENNDNYYELANELYKMPSGDISYRNYYSNNCNVASDIDQDGFKRATLITTDNLPSFTPPITIEGWNEETNLNDLLEAF